MVANMFRGLSVCPLLSSLWLDLHLCAVHLFIIDRSLLHHTELTHSVPFGRGDRVGVALYSQIPIFIYQWPASPMKDAVTSQW